jgi:hypothetical protein
MGDPEKIKAVGSELTEESIALFYHNPNLSNDVPCRRGHYSYSYHLAHFLDIPRGVGNPSTCHLQIKGELSLRASLITLTHHPSIHPSIYPYISQFSIV